MPPRVAGLLRGTNKREERVEELEGSGGLNLKTWGGRGEATALSIGIWLHLAAETAGPEPGVGKASASVARQTFTESTVFLSYRTGKDSPISRPLPEVVRSYSCLAGSGHKLLYHKGSEFARGALAKRMDQNWVHQVPGFYFGDMSAFIWLVFVFVMSEIEPGQILMHTRQVLCQLGYLTGPCLF